MAMMWITFSMCLSNCSLPLREFAMTWTCQAQRETTTKRSNRLDRS